MITIRLFCAGGMSTSLLVTKMRQAAADAGVEADIDTYEGLFHAFDMLRPDLEQSQEAIRRFNERFDCARRHYFADQPRWS
jgi:acetyl esterase/lipase